MPTDFDVAVFGAGAAGLMAALTAAERGRRTILLEKNPRVGVKILMSGGTRCNLTQNTDSRGIIEAYGDQGRFLHSALADFSPQDLVRFFAEENVPTKIEDTNKIFPVSDSAADVAAALERRCRRSGVTLALAEAVKNFVPQQGGFAIETVHRTLTAETIIVTTGGLSYPGSGTTGDGYAWAAACGHALVPTRPALTPLTTNADWVRELTGLTLPDVFVRVVPRTLDMPIPPLALRKAKGMKKGVLAERRGSLLCTHFGLSGPVILDVSRAVTSHSEPQSLDLECDFLPDVAGEMLANQLQRECESDGKKSAGAIACRFLPRRLVEALFKLHALDLECRAAQWSKRERGIFAQAVKAQRIPLSGALGYKKAEVTAGGVALSEIDSKTMQSKLTPRLYFAGEVLDLDGPIGGYNFQAAFATGRLAGLNA